MSKLAQPTPDYCPATLALGRTTETSSDKQKHMGAKQLQLYVPYIVHEIQKYILVYRFHFFFITQQKQEESEFVGEDDAC